MSGSNPNIPTIAILGGGISGLSAAHRLEELAREAQKDIKIVLFEAAERFGGVIDSGKKDDFLLEYGPDCLTRDIPAAIELIKRLGIEDELVGVQPKNSKLYICYKGKLTPFPEGFYLIAPLKARALFELPFMSWPGKIRMGMELFMPKKKGREDESLGSFIRRRFGEETVQKIAQPLLGSIFGCDIDQLSIQASFPRFRDLELKYGSVIRGLLAAKKKRPPQRGASKIPPSFFLSFKEGMRFLPKKIEESLKSTDRQATAEVISVRRAGPSWRVETADGKTLEADAVLSALPAPAASKVLGDAAAEVTEILDSIPGKSMLVANFSFKRDQLGTLPAASGFIGADSDLKIMGCTFSSQKFEGRAPEDHVLVRSFVGKQWCDKLSPESDEVISEAIFEDLQKILKIEGRPLFSHVSFWTQVMPLYLVGHTQKMDQLDEALLKFPGLYLTGNSYRGVGVPGCIKRAEESAEMIFQKLCHAGHDGYEHASEFLKTEAGEP